MLPLHQRLHLYIEGNDTYIFAPEGGDAETLTIYRSSGDVVLNKLKMPLPLSARRSSKVVHGILGFISLSLSEYIIVVTGREIQGRLMGNEIYRATDFDILPLNPNLSPHSTPPHPVESHLLALVRSHLYGGNFLFSYTWDITRRLQAQWETREKDERKPFWEVVDDRFFWNKFLQSKLIDLAASSAGSQDLGSYILPIMYGTFDLRPAFLHGRHMQLCLISRRSRFRAGTRYLRRGIDHEGHVANFNETEQIVLIEEQPTHNNPSQPGDGYSTKFSFVQIRGSVPLFWAEISTLRYKPDLQIMDLQDTADVMRTHIMDQVSKYGSTALVNLVNQVGHEKPVKEAYEKYYAQLNLPNTRYEYFDFHRECRKMQWDRISILIDRLKDDIDKDGYFQVNADTLTPVKFQNGVIRTNCMDNLDRTNVVQAAFAKYVLNEQLRKLDILTGGDGIDDYETFSRDFREMWADHADSIARAYGGSGALKSDFTRTNKRTRKGLLEDGYKSMMRYVKNTFFDGTRQDGFDLVTGAYVPRKNPSAALFLVSDTRPLITRSMPVVASFSLFMICAGLTLPRTSDYSLFYFFMIWFILLTMSLVYMLIHGIDYVSWPRLNPPTDIIYYSGPGFRSAHHGLGFKGINEPDLKRTNWLSMGAKKALVEEVELGTLKKRVE